MGIKQPCRGKFGSCPNLVEKGEKYCDECKPKEDARQKKKAKEYDRQRGSAADRGYDAAWQRIRMRKLRRDPICERCLNQGRTKGADLVHHINENPKDNRPENLMSLCVQCHEAMHQRFRRWLEDRFQAGKGGRL